MNKKRIVIIGSLLISLMATGCTKSAKVDGDAINTELKAMKETNIKLEQRISLLESEFTLLKDSNKNTNKVDLEDDVEKKMNAIYTADIDDYEKELVMHTYIPESLTLKDRLDVLTKTLSEVVFSNLPIEVMSIDSMDGKEIATINLKESKENQARSNPADYTGESWSGRYFQGSAGGNITATSLIETLLQKDYKGEWIDGVKFLYNGVPIDFEHVGNISEITYR